MKTPFTISLLLKRVRYGPGLALSLAGILLGSPFAVAQTITVTSPRMTGTVTLDAAIVQANSEPNSTFCHAAVSAACCR